MDVFPVPVRPHLEQKFGVDDVFSPETVSPLKSNSQHENRAEQNGVHHNSALLNDGENLPLSDGGISLLRERLSTKAKHSR